MTGRNVTHGSFHIERAYPHPVERVYAAFATAEAKAAWFSGGEGYTTVERVMDFREGGREHVVGKWETGTVSQFDAVYFDIVPEARIVYAYEMRLDGAKISVSLATIEFKSAAGGARLLMSESGAFLDGYDDAGSREEGTRKLLDQVGDYLARTYA
jgi:uncharacterized protein YndB with AHSA1/START domain